MARRTKKLPSVLDEPAVSEMATAAKPPRETPYQRLLREHETLQAAYRELQVLIANKDYAIEELKGEHAKDSEDHAQANKVLQRGNDSLRRRLSNLAAQARYALTDAWDLIGDAQTLAGRLRGPNKIGLAVAKASLDRFELANMSINLPPQQAGNIEGLTTVPLSQAELHMRAQRIATGQAPSHPAETKPE